MKIRLSLFCFLLAAFASTYAEAQLGQNFCDQCSDPSAFQSVAGDLYGPGYGQPAPYGPPGGPVGPGGVGPGGIFGNGGRLNGLGAGATAGRPGRLWFETNLADQGLGYQGTYLTLGGKNRIFEDRFDGRWLIEGQLHHSLEENGGFFSNIGLERVFTVDAADADVSMGAFYDFDGDTQADFAHNFHQVGLSAKIKTRKWDLLGNGYFPVGTQDYIFGDLTGANCFVGNNIVLIPGIDSALEGFDVTWRVRPRLLAMVNGSIDLGGYQYSSETIRSFGGGRVRMGVQVLRGMIVSAEVNHDERFNTTGLLSLGWVFGANASGVGHEYAGQMRDLESTVRNDHIVRFNQDVQLAIDPATGAAYNVVHVDNTADAGVADGTAERPFTELQTAQNRSTTGDIIAVDSGDGTDRGMDRGIVLQDNQRLYGTGTPFLLPLQGGTFFQLCSQADGIQPIISNAGGFSVIQLANNNDVAGINVDASGSRFGIWGNGHNGMIRSNTIANATEDGVRIANPTGNWLFANNTIQNNTRDGVFMVNALDRAGSIRFENNTVTGNTFDGIHLLNYDASAIAFLENTTSNNSRHGLFLENFVNSNNIPMLIQDHTSIANVGKGIYLNGGRGDLQILDSTITGNFNSGLTIQNWATLASQRILVDRTEDGTSNFSGNGTFANIEVLLDRPGMTSNMLVTNQILNDGIRGVTARVEGVGTILNLDVLDNVSINNNLNDGVRMLSLDGATINTRIGSTVVNNPQQILGNARGNGDGIQLIADGAGATARINAIVENVTINNQFSPIIRPGLVPITIATDGIAIESIDNAVVDVTVRNATIGGPGAVFDPTRPANSALNRDTQNGVRIELDNNGNGLINKINLDNLDLFNSVGVSLITGTETLTDFNLVNSTIITNGLQSDNPGGASDAPFNDGTGQNGIFISATGQAFFPGRLNPDHPHLPDSGYSQFESISDTVLDNFTRVNIADNIVRDFTLDGASISTFGDAQMLLTMSGNSFINNGAGNDIDPNNNNSFVDQPIPFSVVNELLFFDGVNIDAFDESRISTSIVGNQFRNNFERGLSLNTYNRATINAVVNSNVFFGNDRGEDANNTFPPIGNPAGTPPAIADSGNFDFEAINNEEFYIRDHESLVFINPANGVVSNLDNTPIAANTLGIFYPGNTGFNIDGTAVAQGIANLNLSMSSNSFQLDQDIQDFSVFPGDFTLGLDGTTNGPVTVGNTTPVALTLAGTLFNLENTNFTNAGFSVPGH